MTKALVDPELLAGLDMFPAPELSDATLPQIREMINGFIQPLENYTRDEVSVVYRVVPGPASAPDVPVFIYRPSGHGKPVPAFLHIHGGGYVAGLAEGTGPQNMRTAAELGCLVVSVDYRLAPETVAPGSVEDCYAVLRWLHDEAEALGVDRSRIAVGGESAGGGLAAALALLARDRGEYPICFQMLIYPMLDDRTTQPDSGNPHSGEFIWTRSANRFGWSALLGTEPGGDDVSPYAAAARAESLSGLPPAYISVGALDLFLDENIQYASRLLAAGVPTELHVLPGAYHGYESVSDARISIASEKERRTALARAFEPASRA
jgi:acetyl esterase/lipase